MLPVISTVLLKCLSFSGLFKPLFFIMIFYNSPDVILVMKSSTVVIAYLNFNSYRKVFFVSSSYPYSHLSNHLFTLSMYYHGY